MAIQSNSIQPKKKWVSKDGLKYFFSDHTQYIVADRDPTTNDYENFQLGAIWLNKSNTITPIADRRIWKLVGKDALIATWVLDDTSTIINKPIKSLTGDLGTNPVFADANQNIDVLGNYGNSNAIFDVNYRNIRTTGDAANHTLDVQLNRSINQPNTTADGLQGVYGLNGNRFLHNYGLANDNTFCGNGAGNLTNTGSFNVGIGDSVLEDLTNGTSNVAISGAPNLTGGDDNIAIGFDSLQILSTGNQNIAIGSDALASTTTNSNSIAIGYHALDAADSTENIAIGTDALGAVTSGSRLIGIGRDTLGATTTTSECIAIGFQALDACTAADNIAIGDQAGGAITSGTRNISIGNDSLDANLTGNDNIAIGHNALSSVTANSGTIAIGNSSLANFTGNSTTMVGHQAGTALTTGAANTAVGFTALTTCVTGNSNCAFGELSLRDTTASNNSAYGWASLVVCSSGGANSAFGSASLSFLTTGSNNTAVGDGVFAAALAGLVSGSNNTGIGKDAGNAYTAAESSNIVIGNSGVVAENNTIRIGTHGAGAGQQNRNFQAGIRGITTGVADAIAVLIDSAHQLGTVSSSIKTKENVRNMMDESSNIYELRPVVFNYKSDETKSKQYGLIAEEAEKILPRLVVHDENGEPMALNDRFLPFMLLNELQKLQTRVKELEKILF